MAWQDVQPIIGSSGNAKSRVRYKVSTKFGCTVTIPEAVIALLDWKIGERLRLSVGGADLFGKLKLAPDPSGMPTVQKGKAQSWMVKLGRWSQLPDREVDRIAVEHQVEGRALILTLPSHALNVAPQRPATSGPIAATSPPGSKVSVNDKFFNDPKRPVAMASGVRGQR